MRIAVLGLILSIGNTVLAQGSISGTLKDDKGEAVLFANVALYSSADSSLIKVETTNESGNFKIKNVPAGSYFLKSTFVGLPDLVVQDVQVTDNNENKLGELAFESQSEELAEFSFTEEREMVEVKADKTVFNVDKTINSTGSDALTLLRKAPGVNVDNNDNVNVLGRSGVRVYIDGKQLPLSGEDLSNYLKNLTADQIDRIEIISNPGAKYDAEGNAGIIDIRLKKDKNLGANGSFSTTVTKGTLTRYNANLSGNYRNKKLNAFATLGHARNDNFHNIDFENYQNGLFMDEINNNTNKRDMNNFRFGTDFFLGQNHTIGFLTSGRLMDGEEDGYNRITISDQLTPGIIDSVLVASNEGISERKQNTYNLNYRYSNKKGQSLNIDLDYGSYKNESKRNQPNIYYNASEDSVLTEVINRFNTPNDIFIYTAKLDYEQNLGKGKLGIGTKYSLVQTRNTFMAYDVNNAISTLDKSVSNLFDYDENVYAGYLSLTYPLGEKWNASFGVRAEQTMATGELRPFLASLQEDPVELDYLNFFPSIGLTYKVSRKNSLNMNYGRRINRPDYTVLNPFRMQMSELSIQKGNPFLNPEIVNNYELGYTVNYKYNFKVAYSRTENKITRLIGPDDIDPRVGFISWDNLATETVISANASLPITVTKWWNAFLNLSGSYIDNQADYGDGAVVDVQNYSYTIFQQSTVNIYKGLKGELSGYYSGPGVWGGVFKYEANYSINVGLQKEFFNKQLKVRVAANNITNRFGWKGTSEFDGLRSVGEGGWDNRFISGSVTYLFGNQNVKARKRKSGLETEEKRLGD